MKHLVQPNFGNSFQSHYIENIIALVFFIPLINYYLSQILSSFDLGTISSYIFAIVYLISLFSYIYLVLKFPGRVLLTLLLAALIFLISVIYNNRLVDVIFNDFWNSNFMFFWGSSFPLFVLCLVPIDFDYLFKILSRLSIILLLLFVSSFLIDFLLNFQKFRDYMTYSYAALAANMICFHYSVTKKKYASFALAIFSSAIIVISGSRGALLTLLFFYFTYYFLVFEMKNSAKGLIIKGLSFVVVILIVMNFNSLTTELNEILISKGYNSRIFVSIAVGSFLESEGRIHIWKAIIPEIHLIGQGLYADWLIVGVYAHNIFLEILIHFGIIFGSFVLLIILSTYFISFKKIVRVINVNYKFVLLCAISFTLIKLSLSSSYLKSPEFWLFNGLVVNNLIVNNGIKIQNKRNNMTLR